MTATASAAVFQEAASKIGCDLPTIKAVFQVEASGKFFDGSGNLISRFEPHHFPRQHWTKIGFEVPKGMEPWRASLALNTATRNQMFRTACGIDLEAAYQATSWGAPQIMGFNCGDAGFPTARAMVAQMSRDADEQVRAFFNFVIANHLDTHLRSRNWLAFASGYNGSGQAPAYASKLESAYRKQSGGAASPVILRKGSQGTSVTELQKALLALGMFPNDDDVDGTFGPATDAAVRSFQTAHGLKADGLVGAQTWDAIKAASPAPVRPETQTTSADDLLGKVVAQGGPLLGGGAATGLLASLGEKAQLIAVGGVVLIAVIVVVAWVLPKLRGR